MVYNMVYKNWKATDNIKGQLNIKFRQLTKIKSLTIKATTFKHLPHTKTYQIDKYLCLTEMKIPSFYWSTTRGFQPQSYHYQEYSNGNQLFCVEKYIKIGQKNTEGGSIHLIATNSLS